MSLSDDPPALKLYTLAGQRATLQKQLCAVEEELARLAAAVAGGGQLPTLLDVLQNREQKRTHLRQHLGGLDGLRQVSDLDVRKIERQLRAKLDDWRGLFRRQDASPPHHCKHD
jgi:hypothetical protein